MGDERETVERFWRALGEQDFDSAAALFHDDFIEDWPQSGERIRGKDNWLSIVRAYPGFPSASLKRVVGAGDVWVAEALFEYPEAGNEPYHVCAISELRDRRIAKITEYFAAPFEAASWRGQWVERI